MRLNPRTLRLPRPLPPLLRRSFTTPRPLRPRLTIRIRTRNLRNRSRSRPPDPTHRRTRPVVPLRRRRKAVITTASSSPPTPPPPPAMIPAPSTVGWGRRKGTRRTAPTGAPLEPSSRRAMVRLNRWRRLSGTPPPLPWRRALPTRSSRVLRRRPDLPGGQYSCGVLRHAPLRSSDCLAPQALPTPTPRPMVSHQPAPCPPLPHRRSSGCRSSGISRSLQVSTEGEAEKIKSKGNWDDKEGGKGLRTERGTKGKRKGQER